MDLAPDLDAARPAPGEPVPARRELAPAERRARITLLLLTAAFAAAVLLFVGPIPQPDAYHNFADTRTFLGIPRFGDVITNFPFAVVALMGAVVLLRRGRPGPESPFQSAADRTPYVVLFIGLFLTSIGSAYYHWAPDSERLVWDRLPVTLVFMSMFDIVIAERIGPRAGARLLWPLVLCGCGSVVYWHVTERAGVGDLRPYVLVQFYPMIAIPLILLLFPPRYTYAHHFWRALGCYALAKVCEDQDRMIYSINPIVSGHNLKHVIAAFGIWWVLRTLTHRRPLGEPAPAPLPAAPVSVPTA